MIFDLRLYGECDQYDLLSTSEWHHVRKGLEHMVHELLHEVLTVYTPSEFRADKVIRSSNIYSLIENLLNRFRLHGMNKSQGHFVLSSKTLRP